MPHPGSSQGQPAVGRQITEVTRRLLADEMTRLRVDWAGDLTDVEFLARRYDLTAMPSLDSRYETAERDIQQHRINNFDWDDDWILTDRRFDIGTTDAGLLDFLAETVHPVVRIDPDQVRTLVGMYNTALRPDGFELVPIDQISGRPVYGWHRIGQAAPGRVKNLIFATVGAKPDVVLADALTNDLRIVRHGDNCLVYDRPVTDRGLTWDDLAHWWAERNNLTDQPPTQVYGHLRGRLRASLQSDYERRLFDTYDERYRRVGTHIPALIPQVYLHFDPHTLDERGGRPVLVRQRMDFLLLFPHRARVVLEADGIQHYAHPGGAADPGRYAQMVAEDRELRLKGYEVYRFGGDELRDGPTTIKQLDQFFDRLTGRLHP